MIERIPIVKHLQDKDDLTQGRDAELIAGQEEECQQIATSLLEIVAQKHYRVLILFVSPKRRAQQTAEMVMEQIKSQEPNLKIITKTESNLREIDQGTFTLPESYSPGDTYEGLKIGGRIFTSETFNTANPNNDNILYKFGDPVLLDDGTYKYPELVRYFSKSGESYRDVFVRFCEQIIVLSQNLDRYHDKVLPVIFTHGQPHQIFNDLSEVAGKIEVENLEIPTGGLPRICWDLYQQRRTGLVAYGQVDSVAAEYIYNQKMILALQREVGYLKPL